MQLFMANYKTTTIDSVNEFINVIEGIKVRNKENGNNSELLFRGQNVDKPLLPKIARIKLRGNIENIEKLMLEEFRRGIIPLSEFKPEDNWDLLALAQHHGLPTRLLDWTYNALVGLWFAVCTSSKEENGKVGNGVVWVLSGLVADFRTNTKKNDPLDNKITKIFRSTVITRRISAQSGVFTVHKVNDGGKIVRFETNREFSHKLTKIIIPPQQFSPIRNQLKMLGINNFTIFPDLDGFCKHLEGRFSYYPDEK